MKKLLLCATIAVAMCFASCEGFDASEILDRLDNLENQLDDLKNNEENQGGDNSGDNQGGNEDEIPADKTQAISFADPTTKLICILQWDENEDGELSYEEAAAVTDLGTAFKGSSILAFTELKYFTSLEKIADKAFDGCVSLVKITMPEQLTIIGTSAFNGCAHLKKIAIPNVVAEIEFRAFQGCTSLTSITIPDSVTSIRDYAFEGCTSLPVIDGIRYADTYLVEVVDKTRTSYTINPVTRFIGSDAFRNCTSLTSITIPDSVTSIGGMAFCDCTSLTSVTIGNSVTEIGMDAFYSCTSLTSVYCKPTTPPGVDSLAFGFNASGRKIYVPRNSVEAYKAANDWRNYASAIEGYDF